MQMTSGSYLALSFYAYLLSDVDFQPTMTLERIILIAIMILLRTVAYNFQGVEAAAAELTKAAPRTLLRAVAEFSRAAARVLA